MSQFKHNLDIILLTEPHNMTYQIVNDRVLIKKKDETKTTSFGIVLASDSSEKTLTGEVIGIGEGKPLENGDFRKMIVQVGDTVMIPKGIGIEVKIDDNDCIVVREDEILLIM